MSEVLKSPETMAKAQAELWGVIGKGKQVKEHDITHLPYLNCIVKETYRLHPPVPLLLPRKVEQDLVLCGYTIPKGSYIDVNGWAIGHDPNVWEDPLAFKPERFLDSRVDDDNERGFEFIPYSAGRRICPGRPLALRTVPVMLGSLLNSFQWRIGTNSTQTTILKTDLKERIRVKKRRREDLSILTIAATAAVTIAAAATIAAVRRSRGKVKEKEEGGIKKKKVNRGEREEEEEKETGRELGKKEGKSGGAKKGKKGREKEK
ncbi:hypothetical protein DM860_018225 [Cuscuta australis]|uniref:Cytochrome P450 n=1 Tax=Cuscuta australis TaxID=267555 RepID=A0A328D815_9ASTE|nr:hypothetical protein DM860_018225 [Cuscuta australis]